MNRWTWRTNAGLSASTCSSGSCPTDRSPPRREIIRRLSDFLKNLKSAAGDSYIYRQRITSMCSNNKKSLVVDYGDLAFFEPTRVIAKVRLS